MTASVAEIVAYYDSIAKSYDKSRFANSYGRYLHAQERGFLEKNINRQKGQVVDLGCGTGRFSHLADMGIDASAAMLEQARHRHPGKPFVQAGIDDLPLEADSAGTIFCFHVIMHLPEAIFTATLHEAMRVLKPGGRLIIDFPSEERRKWLKKNPAGWHAATSYSFKKIKQILPENARLVKHRGLLFIPVHRFPHWLRPMLLPLDNLICCSILRNWASCHLIIAEKK